MSGRAEYFVVVVVVVDFSPRRSTINTSAGCNTTGQTARERSVVSRDSSKLTLGDAPRSSPFPSLSPSPPREIPRSSSKRRTYVRMYARVLSPGKYPLAINTHPPPRAASFFIRLIFPGPVEFSRETARRRLKNYLSIFPLHVSSSFHYFFFYLNKRKIRTFVRTVRNL